MEKPISIVIDETRKSIVDIINKSKLHPSIVEIMLKGIYLEATMLSNEVSQREKEIYYNNKIEEIDDKLKELTS